MYRLFWADEGGLPANDRGLAYGDGLFETIRMRERRGVLLSRHLERLARDAGRLGIPISRGALREVVTEAGNRFAGRFDNDWVLKLILTRGEGGRGYRPEPGMKPNLLVSAGPAPSAVDPAGVTTDISPVPLTVNPLFAGMKSLNRIEQVMAARDMDHGVYEALMSDPSGALVEGTRTNLLLHRQDGWVTPPLRSLAVAGVMRQWVLERLRANGETVSERALAVDDILGPGCLGFYLLNSVLGVVPVRNLAGHDLPVEGGLATICNPLETLE